MLCKLELNKPNNTKDLGNELHLSHEPCQAQQNTTTHLRATRRESEKEREKECEWRSEIENEIALKWPTVFYCFGFCCFVASV